MLFTLHPVNPPALGPSYYGRPDPGRVMAIRQRLRQQGQSGAKSISFFRQCDRDQGGRCLPRGAQADQTSRKQPRWRPPFEGGDIDPKTGEYTCWEHGIRIDCQELIAKIERELHSQGQYTSSKPQRSRTPIKLTATKERAWTGEPTGGKPTLNQAETGELGERIILAWVQAQHGREDAHPLNLHNPSYALDMAQDHLAIECKTGLASTQAGAWRITYKLTARDKLLEAGLSPEQKRERNEYRALDALRRKEAARKQLEEELGARVRPITITCIVDPHRKVADIFVWDGWHKAIPFNHPEARNAYKGSVRYE